MRNGILYGVGSVGAGIVLLGLLLVGDIFACGTVAFTFAAIALAFVSTSPFAQRLSEAMIYASIPLLLATVSVNVLGSHLIR